MKPLDSDNKYDKPVQTVAEEATEEKAAPEVIDFSKVEIEPLFKEYVDFYTF